MSARVIIKEANTSSFSESSSNYWLPLYVLYCDDYSIDFLLWNQVISYNTTAASICSLDIRRNPCQLNFDKADVFPSRRKVKFRGQLCTEKWLFVVVNIYRFFNDMCVVRKHWKGACKWRKNHSKPDKYWPPKSIPIFDHSFTRNFTRDWRVFRCYPISPLHWIVMIFAWLKSVVHTLWTAGRII